MLPPSIPLKINLSQSKIIYGVLRKNCIVIRKDGGLEINQHLFVKIGGVAVWKMPTFSFDPKVGDLLIGKIKSSPSLILEPVWKLD